MYALLVTDSKGCKHRDTMVLTVNPLPLLAFSDDTNYCEDAPIIRDAGNPGSTYLWSPTSEVTQTIQPDSGLYWVVVTTSENCTKADSIFVQMNHVPMIAYHYSTPCLLDSIFFTDLSTVLGDSITIGTGNSVMAIQRG